MKLPLTIPAPTSRPPSTPRNPRGASTKIALLLCVQGAAGVGCLTSENILHPIGTATCDQHCTVVVGSRQDGALISEQLGAAVEMIAWGYTNQFSPAVAKNSRTTAAGAPKYFVSTQRVGRVQLLPTSRTDGTLQITSPTWLNAPAAATREFGSSLLAADIREGFSVTTTVGTGILVSPTAYGEELLVGAPGTNSDIGAVYWYYNRGSHTAGWALGGELPAPTLPNARFGASLAASSRIDAQTTSAPAWIAVGAPGVNRVYIYPLAAARANPFDVFSPTVLVGPAGSDFGTSLAIADFDGDGRDDIAVGAPREGGTGRVRMYRGQVGFTPIDAAAVTVVAPSIALGSAAGEFGFSLAAGSIRTRTDGAARPGLVIGVPGYDGMGATDMGALCQADFRTNGVVDWLRCDPNPVTSAGDRYGHAVAVGNFSATPSNNDSTGTCASGDEIAVGIPGRDKPAGAAVDIGAVHILGRTVTGEYGSNPSATGRLIYGSDAAQFTGRALAAEYVESSSSEDLLIGSPLRNQSYGRVSLTRAVAASGVNDPISGRWRSTDSAGVPFEATFDWDQAAGLLRVTMNSPVTFRMTNGGQTCSYLLHPIEGTGMLSLPVVGWPNTAVSHTAHVEVDVSSIIGFPGSVFAYLAFDATTGTFRLTIDEHAGVIDPVSDACHVGGNPFTFHRVLSAACDG